LRALLQPFPARLVRPEWATRVVSPAYDGLNAAARRSLMEENPYIFLHVTRSPEDTTTGPGLDELADGNAAALERLLELGVFDEPAEPALYLYRLSLDGHSQTGIVADLPVDAYTDGRLLRHERTRESREEVLAKHLSRVGVASSPVAVTYRASADVDAVISKLQQTTPLLQFQDPSGLEQTVWRIDDSAVIETLDRAITGTRLYITDGHHRTAAALRLRDQRQAAGQPVGDYDSVLCVLFPDDQLEVFEFNRRVEFDDAAAAAAALAGLGELVELRPAESADEAKPQGPRQFAVYADGAWSTFAFDDESGLDARLLHERVITPIFGVDDAARIDRVEYVPGTAGLEQLAQRCDEAGGIGLAMFPEPVDDLMSIVDSGGVLPPKSTFFHPKARSGIFLRFREGDQI
jgi:uncharacterized protein (DUF1015 family)